MPYELSMTVREARAHYFEDNHFGVDGGYGDKWVKLKLGPIPLVIPNTASRKVAVRYHDLHHIVTGYRTDWVGEFEISAWEIGSGCKDMIAAWVLNWGGMMGGIYLCPRRCLQAYVRGCNTQNLYGYELEPLLQETVGDLRERMGTHAEVPEPSVGERLGWLAWSAIPQCVLFGVLAGGLNWFFSS